MKQKILHATTRNVVDICIATETPLWGITDTQKTLNSLPIAFIRSKKNEFRAFTIVIGPVMIRWGFKAGNGIKKV